MEDTENKQQPTSISRKNVFSRRNILKATGAALGATAADYVTAPLGIKLGVPENRPSKEIELKPTVVIMDIFELDMIKENFPPGFSEQEVLQAMGVEDATTKEGLLKAVPQNEEQTKLLMLEIFENQRKDHGQQVVDVRRKAEQFYTHKQETVTPTQISIAEAIQIDRVEDDELGNPILHFQVNPEIISRMVDNSRESVVNMSFEPGYNYLKYDLFDYPERNRPTERGLVIKDSDGNILSEKQTYFDHLGNSISEEEYNRLMDEANNAEPVLLNQQDRDVDYVDGYFGEHADANIRMLAEIARNHPDKLIIAAGGNPTGMYEVPNLRSTRAMLEEEGLWPNNLLVVGYEEHIPDVFTGPASLGADLYVPIKDLKALGFSGASSYAIPVITESIRQLILRGVNTHQEIKDTLMKMCQAKPAWDGNEEIQYNLFDMKSLENLLS